MYIVASQNKITDNNAKSFVGEDRRWRKLPKQSFSDESTYRKPGKIHHHNVKILDCENLHMSVKQE